MYLLTYNPQAAADRTLDGVLCLPVLDSSQIALATRDIFDFRHSAIGAIISVSRSDLELPCLVSTSTQLATTHLVVVVVPEMDGRANWVLHGEQPKVRR